MSAPPPYDPYYKGQPPPNASAPPPGAMYPSIPPPAPQYYGQPPPQYHQQPPMSQNYHQPQNYQYPAQPQVQYRQQPQSSSGLFGGLSNIGKDVMKSVNSIAKETSNQVSKGIHGNLLGQLHHNTIVVLISRMSGRCLQIVQAPTGYLTVDAAGPDHPQAFNTQWTISKNMTNNTYCFSNGGNYLSISNGELAVISPNPQSIPTTARFKLYQSDHFILLESLDKRGHYVCANEQGVMKPPVASTNDKYSHFGIKIVRP